MHKQINTKKPLLEQPLRLIALGFAAVILCGTLLLLLPAATRSGDSCGLKVALFTATSATCVTGMTLVETAAYWSGFGQAVILLLIQIGGLGVMLTGGLVLMLLDGRIGVKERMMLGQSISTDSLSGVVRMTKYILIGTFAAESVGALLLTLRLQQDFGWLEGAKKGVFHAVSAFCNAGFDLMGDGQSLAAYRGDPAVTLIVCTLIVLGGLGFYVWSDLLQTRQRRRLQMHTKVVLTMTAALLLLGAAGTLLLEGANPATLGGQSTGGMLLDALFHSVNCRNAGFTQLSQADFTTGGRLLTQLLMFIGGSPGSTSGGIKITTLAILLKAAVTALRGGEEVVLFSRTVPRKTVSAAVSILVVGLTTVLAGAMALLVLDPLTAEQAMFESIAAFGTAGISLCGTAALSDASHVVLMVLMFIGRVGVMTLGLGTMLRPPQQQDIRYADGKIMI